MPFFTVDCAYDSSTIKSVRYSLQYSALRSCPFKALVDVMGGIEITNARHMTYRTGRGFIITGLPGSGSCFPVSLFAACQEDLTVFRLCIDLNIRMIRAKMTGGTGLEFSCLGNGKFMSGMADCTRGAGGLVDTVTRWNTQSCSSFIMQLQFNELTVGLFLIIHGCTGQMCTGSCLGNQVFNKVAVRKVHHTLCSKTLGAFTPCTESFQRS